MHDTVHRVEQILRRKCWQRRPDTKPGDTRSGLSFTSGQRQNITKIEDITIMKMNATKEREFTKPRP